MNSLSDFVKHSVYDRRPVSVNLLVRSINFNSTWTLTAILLISTVAMMVLLYSVGATDSVADRLRRDFDIERNSGDGVFQKIKREGENDLVWARDPTVDTQNSAVAARGKTVAEKSRMKQRGKQRGRKRKRTRNRRSN